MLVDPLPSIADRRVSVRRDLALAIAVAAMLTIAWTISDWASLRWLLLPDTDDMARLAQVRDWLNGQAFNDWTQYRLGPPGGAPMHWSRINDIGIAGLILAGRQVTSPTNAEIGAVIVYPFSLFTAYLAVTARIGRRMWSAPAAGPIALLLGALAYPADTLFLPGRIDHHALQIVCLTVAALAAVDGPSRRAGIVAGTAIGISLGIGLETLPQIVALTGALGLIWIIDGTAAEGRRLSGLGIGLLATTVVMLATMRPTLWTDNYCDTFTPASTSATAAAALVLIACRLRPFATSVWQYRAAIVVAGGASVLGLVAWHYPTCFSGPYGRIDPFLRRVMIGNISEATPIIGPRPWSESLALGGLLLMSLGAAIWAWRRHRSRRKRLTPVIAIIAASSAVALVQARGANFGAALAAPLLAGVVLACRVDAGGWRTISGWLGCCGLTWSLTPTALARAAAFSSAPTDGAVADSSAMAGCRTPQTFAAINRLPHGTVMASIDLSAYLLGATGDRVVGSSYHRNARGDAALYGFFLSPSPHAYALARHWAATYVAFCPGDFDEIDVTRKYPDSVAAKIALGHPTAWLTPVALPGSTLHFYRIE